MPAGTPSSARLVAAQARMLRLVVDGRRFGVEGDPKLYKAAEAFNVFEAAHKLDVLANTTTSKVLNAIELSIERMVAARSGERVDQWSTFAETKFYTVAQRASEPVRSASAGAGEEEEEEIIIPSDDEEGGQLAPPRRSLRACPRSRRPAQRPPRTSTRSQRRCRLHRRRSRRQAPERP
jgi:hypothetical protein